MKFLFTQFFLTIVVISSQLVGAHEDILDTKNIESYVKRLKLTLEDVQSPKSYDLLDKLVKAHLMYVPFENLNMHTTPPIPISTDLETIANKLLNHRQGKNRGGYCYEINELFFQLLKALGFDATRHKASVWMGKDPNIIPYPSHQLTSVQIDGIHYLVDVGFGLFNIYQAVKLPTKVGDINSFVDSRGKEIIFEKVQFDENFGPEQNGQYGYIYKRWSDTKQNFERVSTFTLQPYQAKDFLDNNTYVQHKYQPFLDNVMYTRFTNEGQMIICVRAKITFENTEEILRWINENNSIDGAIGL